MKEPKPDLAEARRLLDAGLHLVQLHPLSKRPMGKNWNDPAKRVTHIDERATGYGLPLAANKLCSIDPDNWELAKIGMDALGFNLEELMNLGARTKSTRQGSGGRSAFAEDGDLSHLKFFLKSLGTILEFRADAGHLQDCVPGLIYEYKDGQLCTQYYANDKRLDDAPPLPDELLRWWERCSVDLEFKHSQETIFYRAISDYKEIKHTQPNSPVELHKTQGERNPLGYASYLRFEFNNANTVESILEKNGYQWHPELKRYSHPEATGEPGISQIPNKNGLWCSHHASDPLNGTFDAWKAWVILHFLKPGMTEIEATKQAEEAYLRLKPSPFEAIQDDPNSLIVGEYIDPYPLVDIKLNEPGCIEYVIPGFLEIGVTTIAGTSGVGKTTCITPLALEIAGLIKGELKPLRRKVIMVTEAHHQVEMMIRGFKNTFAIGDTESINDWFQLRQASRLPPNVLKSQIERLVNSNSYTLENGFVVYPLFILDTSNACLDIENENDSSHVGKFIAAIKDAASRASVWIITHTAKTNQESKGKAISARGSGAFEGDSNGTAVIYKDHDHVYMQTKKVRFQPTYRQIDFETELYTETAKTPWGENQTTSTLLARPLPYAERAHAARIAKAKEEENLGKDIEQKSEIKRLVRKSWHDKSLLSKNNIRETIQRKHTEVDRLIEELINSGDLIEIDVPKGYRGTTGQLKKSYYAPTEEDKDDLKFVGEVQLPWW